MEVVYFLWVSCFEFRLGCFAWVLEHVFVSLQSQLAAAAAASLVCFASARAHSPAAAAAAAVLARRRFSRQPSRGLRIR